ncbi:14798_t:CDS:2 [Gigaspora margarita]|uniref:14798_t:CDS:1 n=1 Tax=Gigaspora margarita TaxID=4874 RepID=A0ABN7UFV5_GIGMA|nr:14798_t:CDS:2 [Gigaspora margarita]
MKKLMENIVRATKHSTKNYYNIKGNNARQQILLQGDKNIGSKQGKNTQEGVNLTIDNIDKEQRNNENLSQ